MRSQSSPDNPKEGPKNMETSQPPSLLCPKPKVTHSTQLRRPQPEGDFSVFGQTQRRALREESVTGLDWTETLNVFNDPLRTIQRGTQIVNPLRSSIVDPGPERMRQIKECSATFAESSR